MQNQGKIYAHTEKDARSQLPQYRSISARDAGSDLDAGDRIDWVQWHPQE